MTGILKVDTIQRNDGSTPTAADLGLNISGSILQVIEVPYTTQSTAASTSFVDIFSASITPSSANSKIYVLAHAYGGITCTTNRSTYSAGVGVYRTLEGVRTSLDQYEVRTDIPTAITNGYLMYDMHPLSYLDSPNTTNSISYAIAISCRSDVTDMKFVLNGSSAYLGGTRRSAITLMEIAG